MRVTEYFQKVDKFLIDCPAIVLKEVLYDQRTAYLGFIKGTLMFSDSSQLYFKEFVDTENEVVRFKYGYHYQKNEKLIFRYDNYLHLDRSNPPVHHKHLPEVLELIEVEKPPMLMTILKEIIAILPL